MAFTVQLAMAQTDTVDYEEQMRSLRNSYTLLPFFPFYNATATKILDALPSIKNNEGEDSIEYNIWTYRLAECLFQDNRYSESVLVLKELYERKELLPDEERFNLYDIFTSSLMNLEEFKQAESVAEAAVEDAKTIGDKKSISHAISCLYRVRSADPKAEYVELWSLLRDGYLIIDIGNYSYSALDFLYEMLVLSWNNGHSEDVDYVIEQLHRLGDSTDDINTQCGIQRVLYNYYYVSATSNNLEQLESTVNTAELKYNEYCRNLDKESIQKGGRSLNLVQVQAFKTLLSMWNHFSEFCGRIGQREKSIAFCDKIIKSLTREEDGTSSTQAERFAHVGNVLDEEYLSRAYLRKSKEQIILAQQEWNNSGLDTLRIIELVNSIKESFDTAFSILEFDADYLVKNKLSLMNDADREFVINKYRTVLGPALQGAYIYSDPKYLKSAFNLLMFFKNLLLYFEKGDFKIPEKIDDIRLKPKEAVIEFGYDEDEEQYYALILNGSSQELSIEQIPESWLNSELKKGMVYRNPIFCTSLMSYFEPHVSNCDVIYYSPFGLFNTINLDAVCRQTEFHHSFLAISSSRLLCHQIPDKDYKTAALFGGLIYGTGKEIKIDSTRTGWNSLLYSKEEVDRISKTMKSGNCDAILYSGTNGTENVVKDLSHNSPDIIHFATHGFFIEDGASNPYYDENILIKTMNRSGLILSNGQRAWLGNSVPKGQEDGVLLAGEIAMLDLAKTDIVSLSACNTGQGVITSEGVFGLQRAFKKAGVQTIIMSLWKVQDKVAMEFMDCFYSALFQGKSKRQSFDIAQKFVIKNYGDDPYYWAPFIMMDGIEANGRQDN